MAYGTFALTLLNMTMRTAFTWVTLGNHDIAWGNAASPSHIHDVDIRGTASHPLSGLQLFTGPTAFSCWRHFIVEGSI